MALDVRQCVHCMHSVQVFPPPPSFSAGHSSNCKSSGSNVSLTGRISVWGMQGPGHVVEEYRFVPGFVLQREPFEEQSSKSRLLSKSLDWSCIGKLQESTGKPCLVRTMQCFFPGSCDRNSRWRENRYMLAATTEMICVSPA